MLRTLTHPGSLLVNAGLSLLFVFGLSQNLKASGCYNDYEPPIAICDAHTVVSLGNDGVATVYATTFDDGSYDNCQISQFLVRRMNPGWCPYGVVDDTEFRPYVQFCCEDVSAGYIWIVFRVVDAAGNHNDCMVEVNVQDKLDPWIWCPPDITVSCEFWFNPDALWNPWDRTFGTVVPHQNQRQPIIINDPGNHQYYQPHNWGLDGYAKDNCEVSISISNVTNYGGNCGAGTIHRTFKATDWGGRTAYCTQKITVKDFHYGGFYIDWPDDYHADGCDHHYVHPDYLPDGYDYPSWNTQGCGAMIGYNWEDQEFHFVDGACSKILRKWTVIDWCKYDPHHPYSGGIWTHTQVIKLGNHYAPTFEFGCYDITVNGEEPYCKGKVVHDPGIWDDCTPIDEIDYEYKVDIDNNGSIDIIRHGKRVLNEVLPVGWHKVWWIVDDGCGNVAHCQYKVKVVDKKKPTPVCYYGLSTVVMPSSGMITIWAKDFNASSFDNCTPQYALKYSFSADPYEASRVFTCDDIGTVPVQIWVHDKDGNKDYCTTFIIIADNEDVCPGMNPLQGLVTSFAGEPVDDAEVMLYKIMPNDDLLMDRMKLSDEEGHYQTGFGTTQYDRFLTAQKKDELMRGISTLDLILMQNHIMGFAPFTMTEQYLAADIDNSKHTGVKDMLRLRDLILGAKLKEGELPWLFFPEDCALPAVDQPYDVQCESGFTIDHTSVPQHPFDFFTVKVGDINGDVVDNLSGVKRSTYPVNAEWYHALNGDQVLRIIAGEDIDYAGMQLSMFMPGENFTVNSGRLSLQNQNYRLNEDTRYLNLVHTEIGSSGISAGEVLFSFVFSGENRDLSKLELDTEHGLLNAELYTGSLKVRPLMVLWGSEQVDEELVVRSNESVEGSAILVPNPFSGITRMHVSIQTATTADLEITTLRGELVYSEKVELTRGANVLDIDGTKLGASGVYIYRLHTSEATFSGKMMRIGE